MLQDLRDLTPEQEAARWDRALEAKALHDVAGFPRLAHWNYDPCPAHTQLVDSCQRCGARFRRHQRTGVLWLWLAKRGLLSDPTGSGKTIIILGLLAMLRQSGELGHEPGRSRAVVVCNAPAQWLAELRRFTRGISAISATGTVAQRQAQYTLPWDVLFISPAMLRLRTIRSKTRGTSYAGDLEIVQQFRPGIVVYDDVDEMRNPENKGAYAVNRLTEEAHRAVGVHATPLQKHLAELHSFLVPLGGLQILGPRSVFEHLYVQTATVMEVTTDQMGRKVEVERQRETGVKNGAQLKRLIAPLVMRRTPGQIDDLEMPALVPSTIWLDPSPAQAERYRELRKGILRKIREEGEVITRAAAMAQFTHGWQICSGLATLDGATGRADSVKLDWLMDRITGDFAGDEDQPAEKVVAFVNFTPNVEELSRRLTEQNVGHVLQWGPEANPRVRAERLERFRSDPDCRVLIGTTSIERSLNLQSARYLVAVDTVLNPARMQQIAGRIKRAGSAFRTVYMLTLLLRGTQEQHYPGLLAREAAVADYIWTEQNDMFQRLTPLQLLQLVSGDPSLTA